MTDRSVSISDLVVSLSSTFVSPSEIVQVTDSAVHSLDESETFAVPSEHGVRHLVSHTELAS